MLLTPSASSLRQVIHFLGVRRFGESQPLRVFSTHRWDEWESRPPEVEALA